MPDTLSNPPAAARIADLRLELAARNLDAFILPRFDAHQGEYVAPHDERLAYVTGFTGSAGMAIVTTETVAVFVDGRYSVQVANECAGPWFSRLHIFDQPPEHWLSSVAREGWQVGCDPMHLPPGWYDRFAAACAQAGARMQPQKDNPVDAIWQDQPSPPSGQVTVFPVQLSGRSCAEKCADMVAHLNEKGAECLVETQPDNIAWLLNLRGDDVAFNPMPQSFLIADRTGEVSWFVNPTKLNEAVQDHLPAAVTVYPMSEFLTTLRRRCVAGVAVLFDPDFSPVAVRQTIAEAGATPVPMASALTRAKAIKNPVELTGLQNCHVQDGVAWAEFSCWLAETVPARAALGHPVTEREAEEKILSFRQDRPGFLSESFQTISAAGGNAAMCHYAATNGRNAPILPEHPYLLDSGGQYETGTTDATRSFAFDLRPEGYDRAYTAVFKAFQALATLRFPRGTQGHHIDAICRRPLWDLGLDYDHGTGHGIGHRLSVHEHPQRIGKPYNPVDLTAGMVVSIEPGYYEADRFGIRIENIFEIIEETDGFLAFRNMTWAPIQTDMLIPADLSAAERLWLNSYHQQVLQRLAPLLSESAHRWLSSVTAEI
ncbi:aminopeptidase P family protein (plasmid) [Phaeobacter inhibens]|uniref:aminopeptidase P family protein n=1 Tax=Phaeobacter inhibens TaxID=221822 RepID=UPI0021A4F808|nr:aminopeptidase P family protein [Phaeobacter inhibens]UWS06143.1 aminopeptidase P family protein [Phaeobacter inhibens]